MFHRHQWVETSRTFTASLFEQSRAMGATNINTGKFASQEAADRAYYGFTSIELRCDGCGKVEVLREPGRVGEPTKVTPTSEAA